VTMTWTFDGEKLKVNMWKQSVSGSKTNEEVGDGSWHGTLAPHSDQRPVVISALVVGYSKVSTCNFEAHEYSCQCSTLKQCRFHPFQDSVLRRRQKKCGCTKVTQDLQSRTQRTSPALRNAQDLWRWYKANVALIPKPSLAPRSSRDSAGDGENDQTRWTNILIGAPVAGGISKSMSEYVPARLSSNDVHFVACTSLISHLTKTEGTRRVQQASEASELHNRKESQRSVAQVQHVPYTVTV
jgi:hypothetical protein